MNNDNELIECLVKLFKLEKELENINELLHPIHEAIISNDKIKMSQVLNYYLSEHQDEINSYRSFTGLYIYKTNCVNLTIDILVEELKGIKQFIIAKYLAAEIVKKYPTTEANRIVESMENSPLKEILKWLLKCIG